MPVAASSPPGRFAPPPLSEHETQWLIKHARESARELVESVRGSHGAVRWHEAGTYKRVQMYKGEPRAGQRHRVDDGRVQLLCGRTRVESTVEQVAAFFDVSSTPKMQAFAATQDDVQDGAALYTLVAPGPESGFLHQVTVKWMAVRMPSGLAKARDFVTLECQDSFTDPSGRRGWVRAYHSIKMPCCPEVPGFVRGSLYHSGYVFVETETPGVLTCLSTLQVDLKGNLVLPRALYDVGVKRRISALAHLQDKLHARRLSEQLQPACDDRGAMAVPRSAWCALCAAGFSVFTRKTECRACGAAVCHACTELVAVAVSGSEVSVRVCAPCATRHRVRGTSEMHADAKRKTHAAKFLTDPGSARGPVLQRPVGNHRASARVRRNTTLASRGGDGLQRREPRPQPQPQQRGSRHEKPIARLDSLISTACSSHRRELTTLRERAHSQRLAQADLSSEVPSPSSHGREHGAISFCDSLDSSHVANAPSDRPVQEEEVEIDDSDRGDQDAAASAVDLYRGILALQRAQRTALSASTRGHLAQELGVLYAKLDEAMRRYELEQ